jgi:hypothetical protein
MAGIVIPDVIYDPTIGRFISPDTVGPNFENPQTLNRFSYCLNNPLKYVDPSGCTIKLSAEATDEQIQEFERAIAYLQTTKTGAILIQKLMDSPEVFTIVFINADVAKRVGDTYDDKTKTISWDPTAGAVLNDQSILSPALALAHEMGHGAQQLDGLIEKDKDGHVTNGKWLEKNNLATWETTIAKELGEYTRKNYREAYNYRRVNCSTGWGYLQREPGKWWEFWHWTKIEFVNQNYQTFLNPG